MLKPRPTTARQASTPPTWTAYRRSRLGMAELALTRAGRILELIPDDGDAGRMAAWAFRLAARCRAELEAAA